MVDAALVLDGEAEAAPETLALILVLVLLLLATFELDDGEAVEAELLFMSELLVDGVLEEFVLPLEVFDELLLFRF